MDKRVIFAVAGSGKTTHLVNQLNENERFLLVTYTNNNVINLREGIIEKFGYFPENIRLYSYYSFLYGFCYKPFLHDKLGTKGINYKPNLNRYAKSDKREYYIDKNNRLYSSRISKLIIKLELCEDVSKRISKYFDHLFIDEIQDFGGHDFNLLKKLAESEVSMKFVGDFFQHTFDTSRDGRTNSNLHKDFDKYRKEFESMGLTIDDTTLSKSYRCSPTICQYIADNLGIEIESHNSVGTTVENIEDTSRIKEIVADDFIVKLFFKEHYKFSCHSRNWGDSKGENQYHDVCVVLNKTTMKLFEKGKLDELKPTTKNKLYVAISRARNNLYLIEEDKLK